LGVSTKREDCKTGEEKEKYGKVMTAGLLTFFKLGKEKEKRKDEHLRKKNGYQSTSDVGTIKRISGLGGGDWGVGRRVECYKVKAIQSIG